MFGGGIDGNEKCGGGGGYLVETKEVGGEEWWLWVVELGDDGGEIGDGFD